MSKSSNWNVAGLEARLFYFAGDSAGADWVIVIRLGVAVIFEFGKSVVVRNVHKPHQGFHQQRFRQFWIGTHDSVSIKPQDGRPVHGVELGLNRIDNTRQTMRRQSG